MGDFDHRDLLLESLILSSGETRSACSYPRFGLARGLAVIRDEVGGLAGLLHDVPLGGSSAISTGIGSDNVRRTKVSECAPGASECHGAPSITPTRLKGA